MSTISTVVVEGQQRLTLPVSGDAYYRADGARVWTLNRQTRIDRYNPATGQLERVA